MSIYTGGLLADKKAKSRVGAMREALDADEGLQPARLDESAAIARLRAEGVDGTASTAQLVEQPPNLTAEHLHGRGRFASELRPIPYLLRTKRSKRCPVCRHIISKPEAKIQTTRFRIRLVAGSYIPSITIRQLNLSAGGSTSSLSSSSAGALSSLTGLLEPLKPAHFLLTFKNPIFETIKVTLGAPAVTPGRFPSRVTVLCPQFEIDANTDVWDEALKDGGGGVAGSSGAGGAERDRDRDGRRRRTEDGVQQLEVGKIWERGRNWVSIVVEVVPASLRPGDDAPDAAGAAGTGAAEDGRPPLREDEDVLEIPMFVRVEWEADAGGDEVGAPAHRDSREAKEKRELAYWCVLGLGRIRQS